MTKNVYFRKRNSREKSVCFKTKENGSKTYFPGGAREQSSKIRSILRKTPLLPRSSYLTKEIPPFRNSALNVEKGGGKSRMFESDSGERDESLSEVQTLKRSKSKRELAEEVVLLRNNLRKSQVSRSIPKIIIDKKVLKMVLKWFKSDFFPEKEPISFFDIFESMFVFTTNMFVFTK